MELKVYIDVFGRVGFCEKFPDDLIHDGLNEMLEELVNDDLYGDRYPHKPAGFYMAKLGIEESGHELGADSYLQIDYMTPMEKP